MKKENKKTSFYIDKQKVINLVRFGIIGILLSIFFYTFAADLLVLIARQSATTLGSNQGQITFSYTGGVGETYYVEKGGNSTIIGNYLKGYYYDSGMGFFQLDWSGDQSKNVSIISSTEKCGNSYGYKLGGFAYNYYYGFIQFNYSPDIFVYYCEGDGKLHGYAYNKYLGFQSFEGIGFEILSSTGAILGIQNSDLFVNDTNTLGKKTSYTGSSSNYGNNGIGADTFNIDDTQESVIYIIR